MEDSTDRMSQLPEFINHHIMSFLDSPKERIRMSVLSKNWFGITASFPILDFDIRKFEGFISFQSLENGDFIDKFFKYVEYTTSRFCHQNVSAHTFKLITRLWDATQVDIVHKCVELILIKGVQVLVIDIRFSYLPSLLPMYGRVSNKLVSASSLTSLTLHGCELPSSLMVDTIKFKSLKLLKLKYVRMDEKMIKHLTTSCPLLEELTLKICGRDISRLCVYGLQNLQRVKFFTACIVDIIEIEAPNLCFLQLGRICGRAPCLNVASCKKLTTVCYYGDPSPTWKGLADFSCSFPYLETLFLDLPEICKSLKLSSQSLRTFVLHSDDSDFEQLDIDTPNLLSFEYTFSDSDSPFAVKRDSVSSKSRMECHHLGFVDALWFKKLRQFLDKKVRFKELKLCIWTFPSEVEELRTIQSPPFELDHVDLEPDCIRNLSDYLAVVDSVLWCCRPQSLTLESSFPSINFEEWIHIVKFTYEKLLLQEDEGQTNIHIVTSSSSNAKKHFSDLSSLLMALPRDGLRPIITFIKEQVVQEAG
ncbi:F-box domain, Leucine-rich repeat domain, L domain-like protein [Artemisia annua]|uniref:F-box domain, Leucine-rich repeat domain, L domain-like protein n=1 Tax=Artemisia annua TaxID=35608 RepID=A0A2U1QIK3_ARTAN|nr:F-box domain, Leucine-rich repeat domain, L domain-like protein [Artemisia annua]